jgi:hypothetical protein
MLSIANCHICNAITDPEYICTECDEVVCEDCMVKMTIHNQIDYCLCEVCHSGNQAQSARYHQAEEKRNDEILAAKKVKADKRWKWYHSPAQIEKRRLKRIELLKQRHERAIQRAKYLGEVFSNIFKGM